MNEFTEQLKSADGRHWLAMQYVLAELSDDDRTAFEDAMVADPELCEAVVEASQLSVGIARACQTERSVVLPVVIRRRTSASAKFGIFAACVSVLALLFIVSGSRMPVNVGGSLSSSDEAADAIALVGLLQHQLPSGGFSDAEMEIDSDDSLADLMVPEWLLTAVDLDEAAVPDQDELPADGSILF